MSSHSLGLFYLHEDADAGTAVPSVAQLRVGATDWSEPKEREKQLKSLIQDTFDANDSNIPPLWVRESFVKEALSTGINLAELSRSELKKELEKHKPRTAL